MLIQHHGYTTCRDGTERRKTVVEHETAEIEVDVLDDFETTAKTLAEELGYSDTIDYTMTTDPETGKVTLVIANASGEDITIEIAEKGDGVIQISPSSDTILWKLTSH